MNHLLLTIKQLLLKLVDDIDAGHTNADEDNLIAAIKALKLYTHQDQYYTKYQACNLLGVSRATFDNLVAAKKIPQGKKLYAGDNNIFWSEKDLKAYYQSIRESVTNINSQESGF